MLPLPLWRTSVVALACLLLPAALPAQNNPTAGVSTDQQPKKADANSTPARPLSRTPPQYPDAMLRYGVKGRVTVDFVIDATGKVRDAVVFESNNPAFDTAALKAVRAWTFAPATRDGKPVEMRSRVPVVFEIDTDGRGEDLFTIGSEDQSKLPPELRYDTPPRVRNALIPVYPYAQRRDRIEGEAEVGLVISAQGRVTEVRILSASTPEFGLAVAAAAEGFSFVPAFRGKDPVPHALSFKQIFTVSEPSDKLGDRLLAIEKQQPERIVLASNLDAPLKLLTRRNPIYPLSLPRTGGEAVVEFLVDEEGFVRLPRVVSATKPEFGYAAVQASTGLAFEVPKAGGKAVLARVRVPFKFAAEPGGATAAKAPAAPAKEPAPSAALFAPSDLDEQPQPKRRTAPRFPAELRRDGLGGGEVLVEFTVDREGNVKNARAIRASHPLLEAAAMDAVRQWQFTPGKIGGHAVDTVLRAPITFAQNP